VGGVALITLAGLIVWRVSAKRQRDRALVSQWAALLPPMTCVGQGLLIPFHLQQALQSAFTHGSQLHLYV
jgi:hypothetical protein